MSAEILSVRVKTEVVWLCLDCELIHTVVVPNGKRLDTLECYSCNSSYKQNEINFAQNSPEQK